MAKPSPEPIHILQSRYGSVTALAYLTSSEPSNAAHQKLISGSEDGNITVWDLQIWRPIKTWKAHPGSIVWLGSVSSKGLLISQGRMDAVKVWNEEGDLLFEIATDHEGFCKCDVGNDLLCVPCGKNELYTLNVNDISSRGQKDTCKPATDEGSIMAVKFAETRLVAAYENGYVCVWNGDICACETRTQGMPTCIAFSCKRREILLGTSGDTCYIFDEELKAKRQVSLTNAGLSCLAVRDDEKIYATGGWDKRIRLFSGKSHKKLCVLQLHDDTLNSVVFTNDDGRKGDRILAAGSSDGQISLWNLYNDE